MRAPGVDPKRPQGAEDTEHGRRPAQVNRDVGMRAPGVEPGWVAPQDPKSCASASFATLARSFQSTESRWKRRGPGVLPGLVVDPCPPPRIGRDGRPSVSTLSRHPPPYPAARPVPTPRAREGT